MNFIAGTFKIERPVLFDASIPSEATMMTDAQYSVDLFSALRGPFESKTRPYSTKSSKDMGLTKAFASGKAKLELGNPVDSDVKRARVMDRAKLYPK